MGCAENPWLLHSLTPISALMPGQDSTVGLELGAHGTDLVTPRTDGDFPWAQLSWEEGQAWGRKCLVGWPAGGGGAPWW